MKTYSEAKDLYIKDHLRKDLSQPERRINALKAIERSIKINAPILLQQSNLFQQYDEYSFFIKYEEWKQTALSNAEKSVIRGLFKFSN
ncbi:hypothetical protein [Fulvivirga ligni]|uniref:hypothetical protein n=1 Tax=Fulvivirga ligni TaxID=2904246 RepID=UPI001F2BF74A|nr:hypothetical protein [Fulvivirga ligni]UII20853.1 hypothetical protein LVD16_23715 [Fulvivirga ligni]